MVSKSNEKEKRMRASKMLRGAVGVFLAAAIMAAAQEWPAPDWKLGDPASLGLDSRKLEAARDYALTGGGAGLVIHRGQRVMAWGNQQELFDLKSTSKSIGCMILGLAMKDGKVKLEDPARRHHPEFGLPPATNAGSGWLEKITLRMLADQTAGFAKPGGFSPLLFEPATRWHYSDAGPNWLAECLTLAYQRDLQEVLAERILHPLGIGAAEIRWRKHAYRPEFLGPFRRREFGSGFSANVQAMAKIGYLHLRGGRWGDAQILPENFIQAIRQPDPALARLPVHEPEVYGRASSHYGLLWWNNSDAAIAGFPQDAFWSWGLGDSLILVVPSLDLVVARAGKAWKRHPDADHYQVLAPFFLPLAAAFSARTTNTPTPIQAPASAPCPPSPIIRAWRWVPPETVVRLAPGSDNWPMTWLADGTLLTAYGDGRGFAPFLKEKLSLGLAYLRGVPPLLEGINLRAPTIESRGDGPKGPKASGLLAVEGKVYLWARNTANARLAWSADRGVTWTWANWRFTNSFGCPTFLNCGPDYAGARDSFVYVLSPDHDSAYALADRFVLARVPKDRVAEREAYEFLVKTEADGSPRWSKDMRERGAVLTHPGKCYRSGLSYHTRLERYFWCQTIPRKGQPEGGGLAIYDAPAP